MLASALPACRDETPASGREIAPLAVRVAPITRSTLYDRASYVGTVRSQREVTVLAQVPGNVAALAAEGSVVQRGQLLARIDASEPAARSARVDAEVARAAAERDFLCATLATDEQLASAGAIAAAQLELSRKACTSAGAVWAAARASAVEVGAGVAKTAERAPFPGLVLRRLAQPGQTVMPGAALLVFGDQRLEARVLVSERDVQRGIAVGTEAQVQLGDQVLVSAVAELAPLASGSSRSVEARIPLPLAASERLGHGMSVRVDLIRARAEHSLAVPDEALWRVGSASSVFAVYGSRVQRVPVGEGISDRGLVAISGADLLGDGSSLAVSNLDQLRDGLLVYPVVASAVLP